MAETSPDFSLVSGGPLYRLLLRLRLMARPVRLLPRRIVVFTALTWLPLLAFSLAEGRAFGTTTLPFLRDPSIHAKFLLALPLVLVAEVVLHNRLGEAVQEFKRRGIVTTDQEARFDDLVASALRLRDSILIELVLFAFAFVSLAWIWNRSIVPVETWIVDAGGGRAHLTGAGQWLVHVSAPIFQFLILRLYFRLFIWARLLWQVSKLPLRLLPSHPDRTCGLGFLEDGVPAFAPVLFAQAVAASGLIARRAQVEGTTVLAFKVDIAILVVALTIAVLLPLCTMIPKLLEQRRAGVYHYGGLGARCVREFEAKWLEGQAPPDEPFVGSPDISALADIGGGYQNVEGMRPAPMGLRTVITAAGAAAVPFLPLAFTIYSARDVAERLMKVLL